MTAWLSVIMPVHNGSRFLGTTLKSVAEQEGTGVELLVYDSSDDGGASGRICEEFSGRLLIRYVQTPDLRPWQDKVNRGALEAVAPHLAILHQDDLWLGGHLKAAKHAIESRPDAILSVGPSRFIDALGNVVGQWRLPLATGLHHPQSVLKKLIVQNTIAVPSAVFRRSAWLKCGGMNRRLWYTPDWDIYLKFARAGPILVRGTATTAFRLHATSLTMTGTTDLEDFRDQLTSVFDLHSRALSGLDAKRLTRIGRTSIEINCALALASRGDLSALSKAARALIRLGPTDAARLIHDARLIDRVSARFHLLANRRTR